MKLPDPQIKRINNVLSVGPYSSSNELNAAHLGYAHGAETVARMFRELVLANDMAGAFALAKATKTNSFYQYK